LWIAAATLATTLGACSAILDWSGYAGKEVKDGTVPPSETSDDRGSSDGMTDDGGPDDVFIDAPALVQCAPGKLCAPRPVEPLWNGPFVVFFSHGGALPTCDTSMYAPAPAFEGKAGLTAGPARCSCSCGASQGVGCDAPVVTFYSDSTCQTLCAGVTNPASLSSCVTTPACTPTYLTISAPTPNDAGSCPPNATMTLPDAGWSSGARACVPLSPQQGSCGSQQYCLPSSAPFCISHTGDVQCPGTEPDYPFRYVYYQGMNDGRGCTACSCSAPSGTSCAYKPGYLPVFSYADIPSGASPGCMAPSGNPFFAPVGCTVKPSPSDVAFGLGFEAGVDAGSCTPSGGEPDGSAVPNTATTLCCAQASSMM
jgi:hypothetical protein